MVRDARVFFQVSGEKWQIDARLAGACGILVVWRDSAAETSLSAAYSWLKAISSRSFERSGALGRPSATGCSLWTGSSSSPGLSSPTETGVTRPHLNPSTEPKRDDIADLAFIIVLGTCCPRHP